jgi:hypothetical protein
MITDIPTSTDFEQSGTSFLNLAWDSVVHLLFELEDAQVKEWDDDGTVSNEYWEAAQRALSTALALTQQGVEFLLKGRIATISPFLLISGNPNEWPRGCDKQDISFPEFRTIDAQDLIRVHDTFAQIRLPENFKEQFNRLRKLRNSIIHTVNKKMRITSQQIIAEILEVSNHLLTIGGCVDIRRAYLAKTPASVAYSTDEVVFILAREMLAVVEELQPKELKELLGFDKKQRRYICPFCSYLDADFYPKLAQLEPNTPESTSVRCFVCGQTHIVIRADCKANCKGNVIDEESNMCLTCHLEQ